MMEEVLSQYLENEENASSKLYDIAQVTLENVREEIKNIMEG